MRLPGLLARDHWVRRIDALDPDTDFEEIAQISAVQVRAIHNPKSFFDALLRE